jgi:hypothetical protein
MLRTRLAKKVLTKKEQKHLTENKINSMEKMTKQVVFMLKCQEEDDDPWRFCWDCLFIARKLGMVK